MLVLGRRSFPRNLAGRSDHHVPLSREATALGVGTVCTADEGSRSISAIALDTGRVSTVAIPVAPHNVDVVASQRLVLAVGAASEQHGQGHDSRASGGSLVLLGLRLADHRG